MFSPGDRDFQIKMRIKHSSGNAIPNQTLVTFGYDPPQHNGFRIKYEC